MLLHPEGEEEESCCLCVSFLSMYIHVSSMLCLLLHCFECLDKVEIKMPVWHTCHLH